MTRADAVAGLSIAGLLLPEAVAYAGIAGLPPQAGVMALLCGLMVYGVMGASRFAIVSATSSSAAVLLAATHSAVGLAAPGALVTGLVLLAGVFFVVAGLMRAGAVSNLIAKPVLRGFALGLALTIVAKQLPTVLDVHPSHGDFFRLVAGLLGELPQWNLAGLALAAGSLALLHLLRRFPFVPAALLVIALGIGFDLAGFGARWGVHAVGPFALQLGWPQWPAMSVDAWMRLGELSAALALILYAESYGSIRTLALRHGDAVNANRDLIALGLANGLSALMQGMPVGAGFSASSANEAAGAQSRAAGLCAAAVVLVAVLTLLQWIAHTPEPVLAAIVIHAMSHSLDPRALKPYFVWRRDRLVALTALFGVLVLGVLDGLLAAIGLSLLLLLRGMATPSVEWLGQLGAGHDFVDLKRHPEAATPAGLVIARPAMPLFFGNADPVFATIAQRLHGEAQLRALVLSLEESPTLDAGSLEALGEFAANCPVPVFLARAKDPVRELLDRLAAPHLPPERYTAWSVDDAVRQALGGA
ncbi:SulP family inorganic anion transporter [Burkholderiaceae bacterium UC74_6]